MALKERRLAASSLWVAQWMNAYPNRQMGYLQSPPKPPSAVIALFWHFWGSPLNDCIKKESYCLPDSPAHFQLILYKTFLKITQLSPPPRNLPWLPHLAVTLSSLFPELGTTCLYGICSRLCGLLTRLWILKDRVPNMVSVSHWRSSTEFKVGKCWMDEWIDGWMDGWMDGWLNE